MRSILRCLLGVAAVAGLAGHLSETAHAENMTVNEYLCEDNNLNVSAAVTMTYASGVLDITVRNTTGPRSGGTDAGWLLTGLGFNLPSGITIIDEPPTKDSSIALPSGSSVVPSGSLLQNAWGYTTTGGAAIDQGHFKSSGAGHVAVNPVNTTLSTLHEDVQGKTFDGNAIDKKDEAKSPLKQFDYAIQSVSPPGGQESHQPYIQDSLNFRLYLSGECSGDLLKDIQDRKIVVSFGSPTVSSVPEPSTLAALVGTALVGSVIALRRRKR